MKPVYGKAGKNKFSVHVVQMGLINQQSTQLWLRVYSHNIYTVKTGHAFMFYCVVK